MNCPGEANPQLYKAVAAQPDEDGPRLAYADWLEQNGQPERARYVRLKCEAARLPPASPERSAVSSEADNLYWGHRKAWLTERPTVQGASWQFLRGFPEHVVFDSFKALAGAEAEVFRYPVRRIGFTNLRSIARLAGWAGLARVEELDLSSCNLREGLHTLRISYNSLQQGLNALVSATTLPRLRKLELPNNSVGLSALIALANWPQAARLTTLDLASTWLSAAEASVVFNSPNLSGLVNLNLTQNRVGDGGARVLAGSPHLAGLKWLALTNNALGADGARFLAESPHLRGLRVLHLSGNQIGDEGANALLDSPVLDEVQALTLSSHGMSEGATARLQEKLGARLRLSRW